MKKFIEFGLVRLINAYTGKALYRDDKVTIPAGTIGTAVEVFWDGKGADVEFCTQEPKESEIGELLDGGDWVFVTLTPDLVEAAN